MFLPIILKLGWGFYYGLRWVDDGYGINLHGNYIFSQHLLKIFDVGLVFLEYFRVF